MTAVDTNVLIYAHRSESPWHQAARRRIAELAEAERPWAIPWPCLHEFLAMATHPRIFRPPSPLHKALAQVSAWRESPMLALLSEGTGHAEILERLLRNGSIIGPRVHDARIAAICIEHEVAELWTADRDFGRMPGLRTRNPLVGP